jgi:hypothetical protein
MPSNIVLWDPTAVADPDGRIDLRYENTVNAPLVSVTLLDTGQEIAGDYTLVFTNLGGGSYSVAVTAGDGSKNPYHATGVPVVCDGSTVNKDVIGGLGIVVSASVDTGWTGKISLGAIMSSAGATTAVLNHGIVDAGTNSTQKQIAAKNVGDADSAQTKIRAVPGFYWTPLDAIAYVKKIDNHPDDVREHNAAKGTYSITFANRQYDGGTGKWTHDVYVNGNKAITAAQFDGTTEYGYGLDPAYDDMNDYLEGLSIIFENTTADPTSTTITLEVMDGWQWEELAEDVSGSPGTWTAADLTLTESGQATGIVRTGQHCDFWNRWNLPPSTSPDDLRIQRFSIRGRTI